MEDDPVLSGAPLLRRRRQEGQNQRQTERCYPAGFEDGGRNHEAWLLESRKDKDTILPWGLQKELALLTPSF